MQYLLALNGWAGRTLSERSKRRLRPIRRAMAGFFAARSLCDLATLYHTDKWNGHWYAQHYQRHFQPFRTRAINLLEIGIGGNDMPEQGGNSLRMWKSFFPRANIFGIDIYDKTPHDEQRIRTFKGSQVDADFLSHVVSEIGRIDVIVDDGSHQNEHVIATFKLLYPHLVKGGIYVIEDTQTSYWPEYGGDSTERASSRTMMGFFKGLVDGLNIDELKTQDAELELFGRNIVAMHFYHNLVFIEKDLNNEGSFSQ